MTAVAGRSREEEGCGKLRREKEGGIGSSREEKFGWRWRMGVEGAGTVFNIRPPKHSQNRV